MRYRKTICCGLLCGLLCLMLQTGFCTAEAADAFSPDQAVEGAQFVKVMPDEYRKALADLAAKKQLEAA